MLTSKNDVRDKQNDSSKGIENASNVMIALQSFWPFTAIAWFIPCVVLARQHSFELQQH